MYYPAQCVHSELMFFATCAFASNAARLVSAIRRKDYRDHQHVSMGGSRRAWAKIGKSGEMAASSPNTKATTDIWSHLMRVEAQKKQDKAEFEAAGGTARPALPRCNAAGLERQC